jgi:hypothetical protein
MTVTRRTMTIVRSRAKIASKTDDACMLHSCRPTNPLWDIRREPNCGRKCLRRSSTLAAVTLS